MVAGISAVTPPPLPRPQVLLIHPPVAKPCEPPAGIARLAAVLEAHGVHCRIWDANLEALLDVLAQPVAARDTWSWRAAAKAAAHLADLRSPQLYRHPKRYQTAVRDLNRLLQLAGQAASPPAGEAIGLSLADYRDPGLSPLRSADLLRAAEAPARHLFYTFFQRRLAQLTAQDPPDLIGISLNFMSQALCAFALAGAIKAALPGARLIMGGGLITSWMRIPGFANPFDGLLDALVEGPGEAAMLKEVDTVSPAGQGGPSPGNSPDDLLPSGFDYQGFPLAGYLAPGPILPVSASRGCYWRRCAFCPETAEAGQYSPLAPPLVSAVVSAALNQMKTQMAERAGTRGPALIHFLDNALAPRLLAYLIAHPPGAAWYGFVRLTPQLADPEFARGLKSAGCVMLKLGIESGSQRVLDALDKGIDLAQASRALTVLKAAGIATYVYLLFGTPPETPADARLTLEFTQAHAPSIDFLNLAVFNLPAHCREAQALETRAFYPGDLSLYRDFVHPRGWHRELVRRFLSKEFKSAPAIRAILQRDPPYFTSNHAPFFCFDPPNLVPDRNPLSPVEGEGEEGFRSATNLTSF